MPAIKFVEDTLGKILRNRKGVRVPINQRSYAWNIEHVEDLLRDFHRAITEGESEYFLGSIIVVDSKTSIEIYDGQQRIATTAILIAAIRDYFWTSLNNQTEANVVTGQSLISLERMGVTTPHVTLNIDDHEFFRRYVLLSPEDTERLACKSDPNKESHKRITEALETAKKHVDAICQQLPHDAQARLLNKWLDFMEEGARVIWVEVADQPTAYRVFETMNDRGLKLSAADLIKNYLYSMGGVRQAEVIQKWQSMVAVLESLGDESDVVDYIRYLWITMHGPVRSGDLFDAMKRTVNGVASAIEFSGVLSQRANDYSALLTSSHELWDGYHPEIRSNIDILRKLGVSQIRPLLLAASGRFSQKEMERLVKSAINWSVRCLISGVPSGNLEHQYAKAAKSVTDGKLSSTREVLVELSSIIPQDDRFKSAVATASVPTASLARYYLQRLQIVKDGGDAEYVPNSDKAVTLEHILPKTPGSGWEHIPPESVKGLVNRLGNQALLSGRANNQLKSSDFSVKRSALSSSNFSLTRLAVELAGEERWDLKHITQRQQALAELSLRAWPLGIQ